jgi:arsenate reductase
MAEALLRDRAGERFAAHSAGLRPSRVHPLARAALAEAGVSSDGLRAKDVGELLGKTKIARAIVLCESADAERRRIVGLDGDCERWILPDPAAVAGTRQARLAAFRAVRDELARRIDAFVAQPRRLATRARRRRNSSS